MDNPPIVFTLDFNGLGKMPIGLSLLGHWNKGLWGASIREGLIVREHFRKTAAAAVCSLYSNRNGPSQGHMNRGFGFAR